MKVCMDERFVDLVVRGELTVDDVGVGLDGRVRRVYNGCFAVGKWLREVLGFTEQYLLDDWSGSFLALFEATVREADGVDFSVGRRVRRVIWRYVADLLRMQ